MSELTQPPSVNQSITPALFEEILSLSVQQCQFQTVTLNYKRPPGLLAKFTKSTLTKESQIYQAHYFTENLGNDISLDLIIISGGQFLMGTSKKQILKLSGKFNSNNFHREQPRHLVTIKPFAISQTLITQAQWRQVAQFNQVKQDLPLSPSYFQGDFLPVDQVNFEDTIEFCQRLSQASGRRYRLPTEAEWEYAARASSDTPFHFGETITSDLANYRATSVYDRETPGIYRQSSTPVNSFPPNAFGLYDIHGNLWQWCQDDWHDNYENAPARGDVWQSATNMTKVLRGGAWCCHPSSCRSAYRWYALPSTKVDYIGFRIVCQIDL